MVLQDTWLFEGTVRENLVYNLPGVTDAQLETVCRAAELDKFVHSLPEGFDTVLSESEHLRRAEAAADHRPRHAAERAHAHPRRGDELRRHAHRFSSSARWIS
ncbi:MAG: hypothetical protein ACLT1T_03590 [Oscillospiraceae bacterium]